MRFRFLWLAYAIYSIVISPSESLADEINISLTIFSNDENVALTILNNSLSDLKIKSTHIKLDNKKYRLVSGPFSVPSNEKRVLEYLVQFPKLQGTYPLIATIVYIVDNRLFTLKQAGLFNYTSKAILENNCDAPSIFISSQKELKIKAAQPELWTLVLPEEIKIIASRNRENTKEFLLKSCVDEGYKNQYPYYAIATTEKDGKHFTGLCEGTLVADSTNLFPKGRVKSAQLLWITILFFFICIYILIYHKVKSRQYVALLKYSTRIFTLTFAYFILKNSCDWFGYIAFYIDWEYANRVLAVIQSNLQSDNYRYFYQYFIDIYWFACLIVLPFYIYFYESKTAIEEDKYVCLLSLILRWIRVSRRAWKGQKKNAKLCMLSIAVKLFYIPYLTSWVINNSLHQWNLTAGLYFDIETLNRYFIALFIYIDTIIYAIGYSVESRYLNSEIKSVDPTLLGWIVCLWCYPPFNQFSFALFDYHLFEINVAVTEQLKDILLSTIMILWGVFAWASVSLGFKASNLTNRGIIDHGPYKYIRHPAYASKLGIWIIQGVFFAEFTSGILIGFLLIYTLRAWTEERHLSLDPNYRKYKKKVKWMLIPGLI